MAPAKRVWRRVPPHAHAVDGLVPQIRCAPKDTDELCAILRVCDASGAAVIPWGGGTAMHWGNPPSRADVVISLEQFNRLVEHDDANLTATALRPRGPPFPSPVPAPVPATPRTCRSHSAGMQRSLRGG